MQKKILLFFIFFYYCESKTEAQGNRVRVYDRKDGLKAFAKTYEKVKIPFSAPEKFTENRLFLGFPEGPHLFDLEIEPYSVHEHWADQMTEENAERINMEKSVRQFAKKYLYPILLKNWATNDYTSYEENFPKCDDELMSQELFDMIQNTIVNPRKESKLFTLQKNGDLINRWGYKRQSFTLEHEAYFAYKLGLYNGEKEYGTEYRLPTLERMIMFKTVPYFQVKGERFNAILWLYNRHKYHHLNEKDWEYIRRMHEKQQEEALKETGVGYERLCFIANCINIRQIDEKNCDRLWKERLASKRSSNNYHKHFGLTDTEFDTIVRPKLPKKKL